MHYVLVTGHNLENHRVAINELSSMQYKNGDLKKKKYDQVRKGYARIIKPTETNLQRKSLIDLNVQTHGVGHKKIYSYDLLPSKYRISKDEYRKTKQFVFNNTVHPNISKNNRRRIKDIYK